MLASVAPRQKPPHPSGECDWFVYLKTNPSGVVKVRAHVAYEAYQKARPMLGAECSYSDVECEQAEHAGK